MSEYLQSGYHPDADQIGAFVEHALPAHEQEQMLGHLAVCPECRAIVMLSLPSVEQPAKPLSASERRPWWYGWTLAWPAAAALAALAVFVFYLHRTSVVPNSPAPTQIASAHPPATPTSDRPLPTPPKTPSLPGPQPQPTGNSRAASAGAAGAMPEQSSNAAFSIPTRSVEELPIQGRDVASLSELAQAPQAMAAEKQKKSVRLSAAARAGTGSGGGMGYGAGVGANQSGVAGDGLKKPASTPPAGTAIPSAPRATMAAAIEPSAQNNETINVVSASPMETESANLDLRLNEIQNAQLKHPLPSRLPVLSIARQARRVVAIDTRNAVFLSKDDGKHWKAVQAQWPGRAVRAELVEFQTVDFKKEKYAVAGGLYAGKAASLENVNGALNAPERSLAIQSGSSLTGTVTDMTGAVIPGASVAVTDTATHTARKVRTDSTGRYLIDGLAPGTYRVEAQARGFEKQELAAVDVAAGRPAVANLSLNIGAATQSVTVEADAIDVPVSEETKAMPSSPNQPAALFEITTETGERWTSIDGATWTHMDSLLQK
jgi:hypothetical protein